MAPGKDRWWVAPVFVFVVYVSLWLPWPFSLEARLLVLGAMTVVVMIVNRDLVLNMQVLAYLGLILPVVLYKHIAGIDRIFLLSTAVFLMLAAGMVRQERTIRRLDERMARAEAATAELKDELADLRGRPRRSDDTQAPE